MQWAPHEARKSKQVRVVVKDGLKFEIKSWEVSDSRVHLKVISQLKGKVVLEIIPPDETVRVAAELKIKTTFPREGLDWIKIDLLLM